MESASKVVGGVSRWVVGAGWSQQVGGRWWVELAGGW